MVTSTKKKKKSRNGNAKKYTNKGSRDDNKYT